MAQPQTRFSRSYEEQERSAVETLIARGVVLDPNPVPAHTGCSMCAFHLFDAAGEELDGGSASALLSWVEEGYIRGAAVLRPVTA